MLPGVEGRDILALSIVMILTGLTLIVMRSRAIMQMVGLITMENGIYLLGMAMTEGLPLVIEMGIFLDVLIAVMVLVILTNRLRLSFMTTDTNVLRKLKGWRDAGADLYKFILNIEVTPSDRNEVITNGYMTNYKENAGITVKITPVQSGSYSVDRVFAVNDLDGQELYSQIGSELVFNIDRKSVV